ncbi:MAG: nucleotide exchange factor GrpE [Calditrichae bacterium]|nr:nucleotide exchange factor GrpE [Calditrichota bacterium]MCB9057634.1 nucleotide exchange factor GrpE [Calditrichia bacterium]
MSNVKENHDNETQEMDDKAKSASGKKPVKESKVIKELKQKLEENEANLNKIQTENEKLKDQLLRKMAEFDNYKRRTEKEFIDNIQSASRELIEELLPVLDDFERSIQHAESEGVQSPLLEGVQLVYKNLMKTLTKRGLSVIEAVGQEFNPDEHDALVQVDSDKYESGYVVDEHLKGYRLNDKVIRHAQVLVSK